MLSTQVQYWANVESKRHNLVTEDIGYQTLNENIRHNTVTENETQRHNVATESYYNDLLAETRRHNIGTESIQSEANEINKVNAFTQQRNAASNEMNAVTNSRNADTNAMNAATNRFNAVTGYSLGLTANQIAQQNADTNDRNATTRWLEWTTGTSQAATAARRVDVDETNAQTNIMNAETNKGQLDLGYENLNMREREFQEKAYKDTADIINQGFRTAFEGVDTFTNVMNPKHK